MKRLDRRIIDKFENEFEKNPLRSTSNRLPETYAKRKINNMSNLDFLEMISEELDAMFTEHLEIIAIMNEMTGKDDGDE